MPGQISKENPQKRLLRRPGPNKVVLPLSSMIGDVAVGPDDPTRSLLVTIQAIIVPGERTSEGVLVESVAWPWFKIIELLSADPEVAYRFGWRQWEEIIAGAYRELGFEVVLTPRSGDGGRDVIATSEGVGSVRILDQVKCYKPGHRVTADEVRSMLGVLELEKNASKGVVTTTSTFAPGVEEDPRIAEYLPTRLELKPRDVLFPWLAEVARRVR